MLYYVGCTFIASPLNHFWFWYPIPEPIPNPS